ncbi:hypothetical protein C7445_101254 [Alicyclobacillus sacchari]|uniref:Uncharacterized protein n=1 Tax=Alicyclobacillus sacchari TaxID=392010 RepID=A0A4R8LU26_9BACL|nr:hypothetical protein [Alicyclobacillus sacchari]TDY51253.1 hypothetical protein C7445_101254 [Alicyclobacillus sacchari]GMA56536.1 hypothetical protein GCM10025858_10390 [Alicyclobacillus sacchari]
MKRPVSIGTFGVVYLMLAAVILTALMAGLSTHPGVVLSIVTLLTALLIFRRLRASRGTALSIHLALLILIIVVGLLVVGFGGDRTELWFASCYGVFDALTLFEWILLSRQYH